MEESKSNDDDKHIKREPEESKITDGETEGYFAKKPSKGIGEDSLSEHDVAAKGLQEALDNEQHAGKRRKVARGGIQTSDIIQTRRRQLLAALTEWASSNPECEGRATMQLTQSEAQSLYPSSVIEVEHDALLRLVQNGVLPADLVQKVTSFGSKAPDNPVIFPLNWRRLKAITPRQSTRYRTHNFMVYREEWKRARTPNVPDDPFAKKLFTAWRKNSQRAHDIASKIRKARLKQESKKGRLKQESNNHSNQTICLGKTKVRKEFVSGVFEGIVKSKSQQGMYFIEYEDGDSEEMDLNQLKCFIVSERKNKVADLKARVMELEKGLAAKDKEIESLRKLLRDANKQPEINSLPSDEQKNQVHTGSMEQVLFIEVGFGNDQHGQNPTKACVRACRNAIEFNSIPSIGKIVPGGYENMKLRIQIAVPVDPQEIEESEIKAVFPYGKILPIEFQKGGMMASSGIALEAMGDKNDQMIIAIACITVGY